MLMSRGIAISERFPSDVAGFGELPEAVIVAAAFACGSGQDVHTRIRDRRFRRQEQPAGRWEPKLVAGIAAIPGLSSTPAWTTRKHRRSSLPGRGAHRRMNR